jgi:hypothetical protein
MEVVLPLNLLPSSKDKDLLSIAPRTFPDVGSDFFSSGEQDGYGEDMSGKNFGEGGSGGVGSGGSDTESKAETEPDVGPTKGLRVASAADGGLGENIDYGGGSAASRRAKKRSKDRRKPKRVPGNAGGGRDSAKEVFGQLLFAPLGDSLTLEDFVAPSTVELRRVFPAIVCVKMSGEELGPGNEAPCEGWNQPVVLETPSLGPPVGNKCNCHERDEELIPEFIADFARVHKLDGGRMDGAGPRGHGSPCDWRSEGYPRPWPPTTSLVRCCPSSNFS